MESPKLESGGGEAEAEADITPWGTWSAEAVGGTGAGGISRDADGWRPVDGIRARTVWPRQ
jgi:hypothetical protein